MSQGGSQMSSISQSSYWSPSSLTTSTGSKRYRTAGRLAKRAVKGKLPRKSTVSSLRLRNFVRSTVYSTMEKKRVPYIGSVNLYGGQQYPQVALNNIVCLTPNTGTGKVYSIVQGTGQQQRIGNQVTPLKCTLKFNLFAMPYSAVSNTTPRPVTVRLYIVSPKPGIVCTNNDNMAQNIMAVNFFQNGNSSLGFLGNLYDLITPVNADVVTLHYSRDFKIAPAAYTGVTGGASASDTKASNDYSLSQEWIVDVTKYMPKKINFDDTTGGTTSRPLFAIFVPTAFNGATYTAAEIPIAGVFSLDLQFIDA